MLVGNRGPRRTGHCPRGVFPCGSAHQQTDGPL